MVGAFVEVQRARRMVRGGGGGWFDSGDFHFRLHPLSTSIVSVSHHRLPCTFNIVSVTAIDKVGPDNMRIVNCMLLPSTTSKNACNLVR